MAARQIGGGVTVDGLAEAIKGLAAIDKKLQAEAVDVMRDGAKKIQAKAQSNIGSGGYRGPAKRGMIGRSATRTGAGVRLRAKKFPWALKAEYGERVTHVYGHAWNQSSLARRTAGPHRPPTSENLFKNRGGYMIQPAIRELGPKVTKDINTKLVFLFKKHLQNKGR